jgi:ACS family sodium-dependent inorganic phosphate cotransporter
MLLQWPRRHVLVALTFLACVIAYTDRVNISVAAVAMREQFGWSQTQKGFVLSAFFVGYLLFMFASGLVAARFGGRRVLGCSVLAWSIFTLLTPAAAMLSIPLLIATRVGMGIGEAAMFPAAYELFGRWAPPTERARAVARMLSGVAIGTVIGLMGSGWLVGHYSWPMAFYVFGVLGLVWVTVWFRTIENDPANDPRLSVEERALLLETCATNGPVEQLPLRLLLCAPVLAIVAGHVAAAWTTYVLISWLPSYFREVHGLTVLSAGLFSAVPWLAMFTSSNIAGVVSDRLIRRGISVAFVRKFMQCAGLLGSAAFLLVIRYADSPAVALAILCAATGTLGCVFAGYAPGVLDVAPRHSAVLYGFSNTFAQIPGIIGVAVTGWLVDVTGTYSAAFVLTALVSAAGALIFALRFDARLLIE